MASPTPPSSSSSTETLTEKIADGQVDSTETPVRYLALVARIRPLLIASSRYLAYTSDIGEAFRPVINPKFVTSAYGISIAYVVGDVGYEGWRGYLQAVDRKGLDGEVGVASVVGLKVARRAVFQGLASMLFPALTIHSSVKYSQKYLFSNPRFNFRPKVRSIGPTAVGLAIIPLLPSLFDEPVETVVDRGFDWMEQEVLGRKVPERGQGHPVHGKAAGEL